VTSQKHGVHGADGEHGHGDSGVTERRGDIDRIDRTIAALLSERMRIGRELGRLKRSSATPARSEAREAEVLARVRAAAAGPLTSASAERIFLAIIEETAACQERDAREDRGDA
jgi:chorismate mutase